MREVWRSVARSERLASTTPLAARMSAVIFCRMVKEMKERTSIRLCA